MPHDRELLFILPTYGHFDYARACLESFVRHTQPGTYHVAIIDDASPEWFQIPFSLWPVCPKHYLHFVTRDGLTRSWNAGLQLARQHDFQYVICGNSDLLFTEGWYEPLKIALNSGFDLVGPVTNAPGHAGWQNIKHYARCALTDERLYLSTVARRLRKHPKKVYTCRFINGFCMAAKMKTWWAGAFDEDNVFDPRHKLTGNENELQLRFRSRGLHIGYVPRSFVFHYRSVSRPAALTQSSSRGAYRHESSSRRDRIRQDQQHSALVERLAPVGEVSECPHSDSSQSGLSITPDNSSPNDS